jgi:Bacterial lectin
MLFKHATNVFFVPHAVIARLPSLFFVLYMDPTKREYPSDSSPPTPDNHWISRTASQRRGRRDSLVLSSGSLGTISHPRFTQITGGTTMRRLPVFISLVGLLILMSGNATQPAQAQNTLPQFNLVGNAIMHADRLDLTVNERLQTGAAWLPDKQQVQDGFEATFDWQINRANPRRGADGFAFVIHNADDQPFPRILIGEWRPGLGYQGIPNSLAIEFDTVQNPRQISLWAQKATPIGITSASRRGGLSPTMQTPIFFFCRD